MPSRESVDDGHSVAETVVRFPCENRQHEVLGGLKLGGCDELLSFAPVVIEILL
jgi:hypothetical protein